MLTHSTLRRLTLAACTACLAVALFSSLSRDEARTALRRLTAAEGTSSDGHGTATESAGLATSPDAESAASMEAATALIIEIAANSTQENTSTGRGVINRTDKSFPILQFDTQVWGRSGVPGIESCYGSTSRYCDSLMYRAHSGCADSGCVLIVNPAGHRTRTPLHIHAYHYNGRGAALKKQMSRKVCKRGGWYHGGFPCRGKARYFHGFPAVFSVAKGAGSISHASITAWPSSCGGGTIVLVSQGCSIEHSISHR